LAVAALKHGSRKGPCPSGGVAKTPKIINTTIISISVKPDFLLNIFFITSPLNIKILYVLYYLYNTIVYVQSQIKVNIQL
jgi:hypothetical protein